MKLSDGQIITLDDNKDYIVVKQEIYRNNNYIYLMTASKPLEVMFVRQENDELNLVIDEDELKVIMELFIK